MRTIKPQRLSRRRPFHRERKGGWRGGRAKVPDRSHHCRASDGAGSTHNYYHADGNGNITTMADASGALSASCRYDPYGRPQSLTSSMASANPLRCSSKPRIGFNNSNSTGLYYYGYRWYDPYLQRWLSRDPLEEEGVVNLFAVVHNSPYDMVDPLGLIFLGRLFDFVDRFLCQSLGENGCQVCCSVAFLGKNILDYAEVAVFTETCSLGTMTLGTPACLVVALSDLGLSHAVNIQGFRDCLDRCPRERSPSKASGESAKDK